MGPTQHLTQGRKLRKNDSTTHLDIKQLADDGQTGLPQEAALIK